MKILCCGDSWTAGYGVDKKDSWPKVLSKISNYSVDSLSRNGATNQEIRNFYINRSSKKEYDLIIFCWSGVTRTRINGKIYEFSYSEKNLRGSRLDYFKNISLENLITDWQNYMDEVDQYDSIKKIHFSVFGDRPFLKKDNFYKTSFLEFLAEKQNMKFNYDIPIFEFDWLSDENRDLVNNFASLYFNNNWKKAIVERENVRPGKYFLDCGHPSKQGHRAWAKFIADII
jgi:hypothetical protein